MTKRDFIAIARALHALHWESMHSDDPRVQKATAGCISAIADALAASNPRFDHDRFYAAVYDGTIVERPGCTPRRI